MKEIIINDKYSILLTSEGDLEALKIITDKKHIIKASELQTLKEYIERINT